MRVCIRNEGRVVHRDQGLHMSSSQRERASESPGHGVTRRTSGSHLDPRIPFTGVALGHRDGEILQR